MRSSSVERPCGSGTYVHHGLNLDAHLQAWMCGSFSWFEWLYVRMGKGKVCAARGLCLGDSCFRVGRRWDEFSSRWMMYPQAGRWAYIHRWHLLPSTGSAIHVGTRGVWLSWSMASHGCCQCSSLSLTMEFSDVQRRICGGLPLQCRCVMDATIPSFT